MAKFSLFYNIVQFRTKYFSLVSTFTLVLPLPWFSLLLAQFNINSNSSICTTFALVIITYVLI